MRVVGVNVGARVRLEPGKAPTGICKEPADGPVALGRDGVAGDAVCNRKHHGGPDQAVYVYGGVDTAWWEARLGRVLPPGTFGENLTVAGLETGGLSAGDRLRVGDVLLEVTAPRIPCATLERRMGIDGFAKEFLDAGRPGVYCRVLEPGSVAAGDPVTLLPAQGARVSIAEMVHDYVRPDRTPEGIARFLAAPVSERFRARKEKHRDPAV